MKLKQIFAAALLLCSAGAWAQTDVTSTYLTNADFEGEYSSYSKPSSDRNIYQPTGWTITYTNGEANDLTSLNSSCTQWNQFSGRAQLSTGGDNTYWIRFRWGNSEALQLSQTITLQAGQYTLSADAFFNGASNAKAEIFAGDNSKTINTANAWANYTVDFVLAETKTITIGLKLKQNSQQESVAAFDNFTLTYTAVVVKDVLETAITAATKANTALGGALNTAIATAQAVYDDSDATQDEVNAAAAALNAAVEQAMATSSNLDVTDLFLTNADLASTDGWTAYVSSSFRDYGNGLIGDYTVRFSAATVDETHLATESCFGFECRWSTNYASYYQTTDPVPAGVYTLTFDVQNVNGNTTNANYNNLFYIEAGSNKVTDTATEWMQGGSSWTTHTIHITVEAAAPLKVSLGYGTGDNNIGADNTPALYVSHVKLSYSGFLAGAKEAWEEAKAAAEAAIVNSDYSNVTGSELTALNTELGKAEPTSIEGYNTATEAINNAKDAFVAAAPAYNALVSEIAYAKTIGVTTADDYAATSASSATSVVTSAQDLKGDEFMTINNDYPNDVTSLLGTWGQGNYDTTYGQGYAGDETYFDKWNGSAMDLTSSATVTLPAGTYAVKVAGRGVNSTTMNLSVKVGDADAVSTPFLMNGDTGKGIDTDGNTNFDESATYSNNNIGRGWQYRYITFTTDGTSEVTIAINGHLNGGTWQSFYAPVLLCDDATYAPIAVDAVKAELQAAIDAAPAVRTANIGDGAFQIAAADVQTYSEALSAAQTAHDEAAATVASIEQAKTDLAAAIEVYNALEINAPADGQLFNVVLNENGSWTYDGKAATYMAGDRSDMGGYNIKYQAAANTNLAQAFTFTKVSGNNYKLSQIDADNNVRYVCTGVPHGGNAYQIRTVTEADNALVVTIIPTNTDGVYNLLNTEANEYIGSQDAGFYTVNSHINFQIVETTKPSIDINTTIAGWGTVMLPFAQTIPSGVKAYTCAEVAGEELTLVEVTGALEANKPYIIEGSWNESVTGNALGKELTYTEGLLTGTYETMAAHNGTYILQKQDEKVGFFQVDTDEAKPNVPANRAYMTISSSVKAFFFGGVADAIQSVFTKVAAGEIYDLAGRKVQQMQKGGVYIIDGKKVSVK